MDGWGRIKMRYINWRQSKNVEKKFLKRLRNVCNILAAKAKATSSLEKLEEEFINFQNSKAYKDYVDNMVNKMLEGLVVQNAKTWREAAKQATKGRKIWQALSTEIDNSLKVSIAEQQEENSKLIRTLPQDVARKVINDVSKESYSGLRASEIAKHIEKYTKEHSRASAKLIARTEVSKSTTALTRSRSESLGIDWYIWRTALDGDRVRKSHRNMEGVLVNWNDPPSPERLVGEKPVGNYHAGNIWNCRCYPEPVVDPDFLPNRVRVYSSGKIQSMTKAQFIAQYIDK